MILNINLKEDNKNGYSMNKFRKMPYINQKINDTFKRQYSQRIHNTFNL